MNDIILYMLIGGVCGLIVGAIIVSILNRIT